MDELLKIWPIGLFVLGQTVAGVWWAATTNSDIHYMQSNQYEIKEAIKDIPEMKADIKQLLKLYASSK